MHLNFSPLAKILTGNHAMGRELPQALSAARRYLAFPLRLLLCTSIFQRLSQSPNAAVGPLSHGRCGGGCLFARFLQDTPKLQLIAWDMSMILPAGEALFDMIKRPDSALIEPVIGGSTLNVALGLARLGRPTGYLTKLSTDYFGNQLADFLAREGIATDYVVRAPGMQTTLAFAFLQPGGHADTAAERPGGA
eukprot:gene41228-50861_t